MSRLQEIAAHIHAGNKATFTGIVYKSVGKEYGKAGAKLRYGDATTSEVIVTGFRYYGTNGLVDRSIKAAEKDPATFLSLVKAELNDPKVFDENIKLWIKEQIDSWKATMNGDGKDEPHYEPVTIGGELVRGAKRYVGGGEGKPDQIYLSGLLISRKVLVEPPNGYWNTNKGIKTRVKDIVRNLTPIGRYKTRRLSPGNILSMRVGGTAAVYHDDLGMEVSDKVRDFILSLEE